MNSFMSGFFCSVQCMRNSSMMFFVFVFITMRYSILWICYKKFTHSSDIDLGCFCFLALTNKVPAPLKVYSYCWCLQDCWLAGSKISAVKTDLRLQWWPGWAAGAQSSNPRAELKMVQWPHGIWPWLWRRGTGRPGREGDDGGVGRGGDAHDRTPCFSAQPNVGASSDFSVKDFSSPQPGPGEQSW